MDRPIFVTRPDMPPLEELEPMLRQIWQSRILTNGGEFHARLEQELARYLDVPYVSLTANGTLSLMLALRALGIEQGEVITTPYSFVATTHALQWSGLRPVFADISPKGFALDPDRVEEQITPRTKAILAVHVYGHPCDCAGLRRVAGRYGLPLIYDASHAFGVRMQGRSLLEQGDMATLSFHATKVFNTIEGGAVICRSLAMKQEIDRLRNFGFAGETEITGIGINAKLDELRCAYGLAALRHVDDAIARRRSLDAIYRRELCAVPALTVPPAPAEDVEWNYSHFPVLVSQGRDRLYERLKSDGILTRRYFYPLITDFEPYRTLLASQKICEAPNARRAADSVLCLPLYPDLPEQTLLRITDLIKKYC